jgi:thiazole synthase
VADSTGGKINKGIVSKMDTQGLKKTTLKDVLKIGEYELSSRLLVGTGKYKDLSESHAAIEASGAAAVTVAIRRIESGQTTDAPDLLDVISPEKYVILPNTAGCYDAASAVRTCMLGREILDGHALVKLEVMGDRRTLYPNIVETLSAAKTLCKEGFQVMVYTSDDPILAVELEAIGCVAIMPLAAPIGSGLGIQNRFTLRTIIENVSVPVIVDAGVGTASDASIAMELGGDGVVMNTAIAEAQDPILMASAMAKAVQAGREAFLAGRMPRRAYATASSPLDGRFFS